MRSDKTPKVLALIPDGNRRWAKGNSLSFFSGYDRGVRKFVDFAGWCKDYGVSQIVVWAFSTENFKRPKREQAVLFNLYKKAANDKKLFEDLKKNETRFRIIGNINLLPKDVASALKKLESKTAGFGKSVINIMIAYGGKDDILQAATALVRDAVNKKIDKVTEAVFRSYMVSNSVPDIDMIIRTSGEERLSGFMPLQSGYSELYFSDKLWPDFTRKDLDKAMKEYGRRQRRFGK